MMAPADEIWIEAKAAMDTGDFAHATKLFSDAIGKTHGRAHIYLVGRSEAKWKQGYFEAALQDAKESLRRKENHKAHFWKGTALLKLERYDEAALAFQTGLNKYPGTANLVNGLHTAKMHIVSQEEKKTEDKFDAASRASHLETYERRPSDDITTSSAFKRAAFTEIPVDSFSDDDEFVLVNNKEEDLISFVAKINRIYEEKLNKPAPFMTFVLIGLQSTGKTSIVERFMNTVISIVQEGTGTRCPLDVTLIHDPHCEEPKCFLSGNELEHTASATLSGSQAFEAIIAHNRKLGERDSFSIEPLRLVYRARNVQNMRFVDTPGLIANKSTGQDNRQAIKNILLNELNKPNARLCVLLEPKEFVTNSVIDFIDETFGDRKNWLSRALFIMSKFDKQVADSRSGSKANAFFREFHRNQVKPYLVITPTLPREKLQPKQLYEQRRELLETAQNYENERFRQWQADLQAFEQREDDEEALNTEISKRIGFAKVSSVMRRILLEDTLHRLPEVIASIRTEQRLCAESISQLKERLKLQDPARLELIVNDMTHNMQKRIQSYIEGDYQVMHAFPDEAQTLLEEMEEEEASDWYVKDFNHYREEEWRDRLHEYKGSFPAQLQAEKKVFGGAQIQRAFELFQILMIDSLPDPQAVKDKVLSLTGIGNNRTMRPDYERALGQIATNLMKSTLHPGINVLVKEIGLIFRRFARVAIREVKGNGELHLQHIPTEVEEEILSVFDEQLWTLLNDACGKMHTALVPLYSTVDPNLPTFNQDDGANADVGQEGNRSENQQQVAGSASIAAGDNFQDSKKTLKDKMCGLVCQKMSLFPDERPAIMTDEEAELVVKVASKYLVALMEFIPTVIRLHLYTYVLDGFKDYVESTFATKVRDTDWSAFVHVDSSDEEHLVELEDRMASLQESVKEIRKLKAQQTKRHG